MQRMSLVFLGVAAVALAACGGGSDPAGRGVLDVAVTDAPVDDAAAVVLAMTELELKPAGGESFRVPVIGAPRELDLTDFTDGATASLIEGEDVPAGEYEWMRVFFDESASYIQLETDGTTYPLVIPSGGQTGFKLVSGFTVPLNDTVTYLLDFDLRRSVIEPPGLAGPNGEPRRFVLKPAVRIMNAAETGAVEGVVDAALVDVNNERCLAAEVTGNAVYVFEGADAVLDDVADEETDDAAPPLASDLVEMNATTGEFEYHLMFLLPGEYTLAFTCSGGADGASDADYPPTAESGFDFDATINVEVVSGEVKNCAIPAGDAQADPC